MLVLVPLTLKSRSDTLVSLVNGSPRTTAFIMEILSCQVSLHTCQKGLKGTARAPLLCFTAWFFIVLHRRPISLLFSVMCQHNSFPYVTAPYARSRSLHNQAEMLYWFALLPFHCSFLKAVNSSHKNNTLELIAKYYIYCDKLFPCVVFIRINQMTIFFYKRAKQGIRMSTYERGDDTLSSCFSL